MARVWRDDAPADGDVFGFARDDGRHRGGRARFHSVLAPPWIRFGEPEDVEAGLVAGLRHPHRLLERLHAELQHTYAKRDRHCCSSMNTNLEMRSSMSLESSISRIFDQFRSSQFVSMAT